ncbi:MAG: hypothetical protein HXX81_01405 [Campylobacterales bacterium]|nr:hypothetical protein [Campylobacterales bacterium]
MTLGEKKDKADIISKEADIVYKKIVVLLAIVGGLGGFGLSLDSFSLYKVVVFLIFGFFVFGIFYNFLELNKCKKEIERLKDG